MRPRNWDYGREVIVDDANSKPSDKTAKTKHGWDYEPPAVTDDAKSKSSEVEITLEKKARKQTRREHVTTMSENVNQLVELGIASLTNEFLENDEYTQRKSMLAERVALDKRGYWKVDRCPLGVKLIRSHYVYTLKKDWTDKVVK